MNLGWRAALVLAAGWSAHEIGQATLTVAFRDGGRGDLKLVVPWAIVLQRRFAPAESVEGYLARTAQDDAALAAAVATVEREIETGLLMVPEGEKPIRLGGWRWPAPGDIRDSLRRELMSRLALGDRFEPASRLESRAEVEVGRAASIQVRIPAVLGPAVVTVFRPVERWVPAGSLSGPVRIRPDGSR